MKGVPLRIARSVLLCGLAMLVLAACKRDSGKPDVGSSAIQDLFDGSKDENWQVELTDGQAWKPFDDPQTQAIVFVFVATDCPIANSYLPVLGELHKKFLNEGIRFILVYPDREKTLQEIDNHVIEFQIEIPTVLDSTLSIAKRVDAEVTPEAFVIRRGGSQPVYRGAIDNQYAGYGKKRPSADEHFLANAIESVIENRPISIPTTKPVGCFISYDML